jgi:hypothetical protein
MSALGDGQTGITTPLAPTSAVADRFQQAPPDKRFDFVR